jgi:hypothetical protein
MVESAFRLVFILLPLRMNEKQKNTLAAFLSEKKKHPRNPGDCGDAEK